jgi:hypothetical protein
MLVRDYIYICIICVLSIFAWPTVEVMLDSDTPTLEAGQSDDQWEFLKDYAKLIQYADEQGYKLTAGEVYRTKYQQRYYLTHGLSWTMNSYHLKRKAADINLFIDGKYVTEKSAYLPLGVFWEGLHPKNRWGGRFNDAPHFERRD